jgi:phospholipase/carboxylesterase
VEDEQFNDLVALVPPLLRTLETLAFIGRHFHPPDFQTVMTSCGAPDEALRAERPRLDGWPEAAAEVRAAVATACDEALAAYEGLRGASEVRDAFRALSHLPSALEALYPLAGDLPPVNRFFVDPARRDDAALLELLSRTEPGPLTGLLRAGQPPDFRGGFSVYVPETYRPDRPLPLVMALHGGSGSGQAFLWSWVREARTSGAIIIAPTAIGPTWSLTGDDIDTPNLLSILELARERWSIDPKRMLLTGMSDGSTFTYVSGLESGSPFTHLAPVSAAFHPMLAEFAEGDRLKGLPIQITHGTLDWMFPAESARAAQRALSAAGAEVTYREIADLSHTYPREVNAELLAWLKA